MTTEEPPAKRRRLDALGRLSAARTQCRPTTEPSTATDQKVKDLSLSGRGSVDGWTLCPLCGKYSKKKYALGKGIASHLLAIHTPWNPTKLSLKIERRKKEEQERQERRMRQQHGDSRMHSCSSGNKPQSSPKEAWVPSDAEQEAWDSKVLTILAQLEKEHAMLSGRDDKDLGTKEKTGQSQRLTKTGSKSTSYRDSLPPFLDAAAKGDLLGLQQMVKNCQNDDELRKLLDTRDRHLSAADHWAAGGGHLECLRYLKKLRRTLGTELQAPPKRKVRRRDGKTSLHYAARNGHLDCVKYLIEEEAHRVEDASGEGTLPLHMACFGGHLELVKWLVRNGANAHATNEWGCDAFQFLGLTICKPDPSNKGDSNKSVKAIRDLCNYLRHVCKVNLIRCQKQGHSILHKAAQKGNRHVVQWIADPKEAGGAGLSKEEMVRLGAPDLGGHRPSEIWRKFQGDEKYAEWMESLGW